VPHKARTLTASVRADGMLLPHARTRRPKMTAASFTSSTAIQPATSGVFGRTARRIGIWVRALAAGWNRRAAMKDLYQLDDRALRDIGISRCQIERAVHGLDRPDLARF
jgi:uncharacterized protein YjiS (DUF1127 family)